jgi:cytochrome c
MFVSASDLSLTIEFDGSNLPDSSGTVEEGKIIFKNNCVSCHGFSGEGRTGPELYGISNLDKLEVSKTIGNFWPFAPKIFDYLRRSKRDNDDNYFSDSQVYSLTAFLLRINGLYEKNSINKKELSNILMPNIDGFMSEYHY